MNEKPLPLVSVVVPAFNAEKTLPLLFEDLARLDYPRERFEVLVIDDGSTDKTPEIIKQSPFRYLHRDGPSGDPVRNSGLEAAQGEIIAFTDADCRVPRDWLRQGIACLEENQADLAAGGWEWLPARETVAVKYHRYNFGKQEYYVRERGAAITANLFVRRKVVEKLGGFDPRIVHAGDIHFTRRATEAGFKLVYCEKPAIRHPADINFLGLLRKWRRVGFGDALLTYYCGHGSYAFRDLRWYLPGVRQFLDFRRKAGLRPAENVSGFFLVWACKLAWTWGNFAGYRFAKARDKQVANKKEGHFSGF